MVWVLWDGVVETQLLFYWFQGRNLLGDDQNFNRRGYVKKMRESNIKGGSLFLNFFSIKIFVTFCYCFSRYSTKLEIPRIKLKAALLFWILWKRNMYFKHWFPYLTFVLTYCEYTGSAANSNAPFCFDLMNCLEFFCVEG